MSKFAKLISIQMLSHWLMAITLVMWFIAFDGEIASTDFHLVKTEVAEANNFHGRSVICFKKACDQICQSFFKTCLAKRDFAVCSSLYSTLVSLKFKNNSQRFVPAIHVNLFSHLSYGRNDSQDPLAGDPVRG